MPSLDQWLEKFRSENLGVRVRAAEALLQRDEVPLWVLLETLEKLCRYRLGGPVRKVLRTRTDPELGDEMLRLLASGESFARQVACATLARLGRRDALARIANLLDDDDLLVRKSAALALRDLADPGALPALNRRLAEHPDDDINVVWALEEAIKKLEEARLA